MITRKILTMSYRHGAAAPDVNAEECRGDCYAWDDVLRETGESWTTAQLALVFSQLMQVHAGTCGNANFRIGVDLAEQPRRVLSATVGGQSVAVAVQEARRTYVGTFYHFGAMECVAADTLAECVSELHDAATAYFATPRYQADLAASGGIRRDACAHGEDQALLDWMLVAGGFGHAGSVRVSDLVAS